MPESRLVYTTAGGNVCPGCGKALRKCHCQNPPEPRNSDGIIRLQLESKRRGGKQVTVISGLDLASAEYKATLKQLKSICGTGGTAKNHKLEIQGDHRSRLRQHLEQQGYTVKSSGG